ncbi:putative GAF sensor protein [Candidatus Accumulibacter phosphatis]|jgi:GAF domain-containing protein|uniref:Putative GAF sensor protein n=2 Tax=Candidatus Accumulibacter TaxID=327159 RepID=C7RML9_ACCRE
MLPPFRPLSSCLDLQGAFAQLSREGFASCSLDETLRQLTATTARMLNIERVSLWGLSARRTTLECIDLYELSGDRHSRGMTLRAARYPEYFRALTRGEPIVADDAMKHPSTQEFTDDYLLMNGISAVINSPIHVNGELQGVLCIERVGPHSAWTSVGPSRSPQGKSLINCNKSENRQNM